MKHRRVFNVLEKIAVAMEPVSAARIAAAILYKNEIISVGFNKKKTHPLQKRYGKCPESIYLHAEIDALINAMRVVDRDDLQRAQLFVCRMKKVEHDHSKFIRGLAKPCSGCQFAIEQFGIRRTFYTLDTNGYEELEF